MSDEEKTVYAKDMKCCECGAPAVALWPCCDPDIPSHPYCRKCLDKARQELMMELLMIDEKYKKKTKKP